MRVVKLFGTICISVVAWALWCTISLAKCSLEISPVSGIGVFEKGQQVEFSISYNAESNIYVSYEITDIWGSEIDSGEMLLEKDVGETTLSLKQFDVGWYRIKFYEAGSLLDVYCAFSIVEPYSERKVCENPFAADQAGQYMDWTKEDREAYTKAIRLAGIDTVRERMSDHDDTILDTEIEEQVNALSAEGINTMEMLAKNSFIDYGEDLFHTYEKAKANAEYYSGSVGVWESVNEADADGKTAPDEAASYYKARAIGIMDSGAEAVKTFGGLCNWNTSFTEVFMQNDVLSYADVFNLHSHRTGEANVYNEFPSDPVFEARELAAVYGDGRQVWVSEAGMSCPVDENETILDEYIPVQAKYAVTSTVESIARGGTDKHFWFLFRHYIENGREFGIFSKNDMPYAAYSALATLTYRLGRAKFLGPLIECPENCKGYMFSDGENDVAVIWNTEDKTDYVQFNTEYDAEVIDIVGNSSVIRHSDVNKKINIPVTDYPVIVKFQGSTEENYFPKNYPECNDISITSIPDNKRIVLKQNWRTKVVSNAQYRIEQGENYVIALDVYNFSSSDISGEITMNLSGNLKAVSQQTTKYSVESGKKRTISFIVAAEAGYGAGGEAYISFTGTAGGGEISPSVSECYIVPDTENMDVTYFDGYNRSERWAPNSVGSVTVREYDDSSIEFKFDFGENIIDRWAYPKFKPESGILASASGITFKIQTDPAATDMEAMDMRVFVWTADGSAYIAQAGTCVSGEGEYKLTWDRFAKFTGNGDVLDPADITEISVGLNARYSPGAASYTYTLKDFGYFIGTEYEQTEDAIELNGIEDHAKYVAHTGRSVYAEIPDGLKNIKVYFDYEPISCSDLGNRNIEFKLNDIEEGAHIVTVAGFDKFNRAVRKSVTFYAADARNIYVKGTFFD